MSPGYKRKSITHKSKRSSREGIAETTRDEKYRFENKEPSKLLVENKEGVEMVEPRKHRTEDLLPQSKRLGLSLFVHLPPLEELLPVRS